MKINLITAEFSETCRGCGDELYFLASVHPNGSDLPLGDQIELACHEKLEEDGWSDGLCCRCSQKVFLTGADKADHENKQEKELR